jgi:hypothetical protein
MAKIVLSLAQAELGADVCRTVISENVSLAEIVAMPTSQLCLVINDNTSSISADWRYLVGTDSLAIQYFAIAVHLEQFTFRIHDILALVCGYSPLFVHPVSSQRNQISA